MLAGKKNVFSKARNIDGILVANAENRNKKRMQISSFHVSCNFANLEAEPYSGFGAKIRRKVKKTSISMRCLDF